MSTLPGRPACPIFFALLLRKRLLCLAPVVALVACTEAPASPAALAGADPQRGQEAIARHGCVACHVIPGIAGPDSNVGPPLTHMAKRVYIGGVLPNQPPDMVRWLMDPPRVDPRTAMPNLGISEVEARDITAYLYTLD
jgi:cytochrome c2